MFILHPHVVRSVPLADEVVGQVLDGGAGVAGDVGLSVVANDDGLLGLGNANAESALST